MLVLVKMSHCVFDLGITRDVRAQKAKEKNWFHSKAMQTFHQPQEKLKVTIVCTI